MVNSSKFPTLLILIIDKKRSRKESHRPTPLTKKKIKVELTYE